MLISKQKFSAVSFGSPSLNFRLILSVIFIIIMLSMYSILQQERQKAQERSEAVVVNIQKKIERATQIRLGLLDEIKSYIISNPYITQDEFSSFSREIFYNYSNLRSLQLAKNSIISHIYPQANNEQVIGHDLLNDPFRKELVQIAISMEQPVFIGPVTLKQGGDGVIFRKPIHFISAELNIKNYWGLAVIVEDLQMFLSTINLIHYSNNYEIALRNQTLNGEWEKPFWGDSKTFSSDAIIKTVELPNAKWEIAVKYKSELFDSAKIFITGILFIFLIFLTIYLYISYLYPSSWYASSLFILSFIILAIGVIGFRTFEIKEQEETLIKKDAQLVHQLMNKRLQQGLSFIKSLDRQWQAGLLEHSLFQLKSHRYLDEHPELQQIKWVNTDFIVEDIVTLTSVEQQHLGLTVNLNEPRIAARLATELVQPIYSAPYQKLNKQWQFDLWLPLLINQEIQGYLVATYDNKQLLIESATSDILEKYQLQLISKQEEGIAKVNGTKSITKEKHIILLSKPNTGLQLHLLSLSHRLNWFEGIIILAIFTIALFIVLGIIYLQRKNQNLLIKITELNEISSELTKRAKHDFLTGLCNREEFEQQCEQAIKLLAQGAKHHVLLYIDLDQFKIVNDTCGHVAGDSLLRQLTSLLKEKVRAKDTLARLGGDEFGVLLLHCSQKNGEYVAEKIRQTVKNFHFSWEGKIFDLGVSVGLVTVSSPTQSYDELLKNADLACYMAKESGRNRIHIYQETDYELSRRQGEMHWFSRISLALETERFRFFQQPIRLVNGESEAGEYYEILLRMVDEDGQLVPPGAFLPAAERFDLISRLDRWVVSHAIDFYEKNPKKLQKLKMCSINLSGQSIGDDDFLAFILKLLKNSRIPNHKLCFEITETAAISNLVKAAQFITIIQQQGVQFALDDFGSGMASFGYLKQLPVNYLKIDGSFIRDIAKDNVTRMMVKLINDIGHEMQIRTVAEFVENDEILDILAEIGVDYAQGYGISKPYALT